MHEGYKLVILSIISTIILLIGIILYRYIYPKKKINFLILLVIVSLPLIINIFRPGAYESGDFNIHIYRIVSFYNDLQQGQVMPSWASELNATYGYPLFIFNYTLPYYIVSLFHFFGFSFILSMKIFLAINFLLSGIFMYLFAKNLFKNVFAAFSAAIFYQFAPYHLIDENFKIVVGEILIFTLLPLAFYFLLQFYKKRTFLLFAFSSLTIAFLIMSHVVIAFFCMALFFIYISFVSIKSKNKRFILDILGIYIISAIMTCYIWLTPLFLSKYTILSKMYLSAFDSISFVQLLYAPWRFGFLFQGPKGEIPYLIGYTQIFIIIVMIILLITKKISEKYKKYVIFWTITTLLICFLITSQANFIWLISPLLAETGSHRLFILLVFCIAILAGYLYTIYPKKTKLLSVLLIITIFYTILNWGQRDVLPKIIDQTLINSVALSTANGEGHFYANSLYRNPNHPWFTSIPKDHVTILSGSGEIKQIKRTTIYHKYIVDAKTQLKIQENTLYFPGWQVYNDSKIIAVNHNNQGVITFTIPKGLHLIEVNYTDIAVYALLKLISFSSTAIMIILIFFFYIKEKRKLLFGFTRKNK
ncbi:MAG TPA: 6-pyruvoyl-tetrahydropterin synthase-related protein [Candidatus Saccharimonadales bacterium]|nr:6-pyruvoyl-tetrahydropterin synthase-related protein [Candidatus Saccharimonadales bacterium]